MDERSVADYFVVAGLPKDPELLNEFSYDGAHLKPTHNQTPITDITVIFPAYNEMVPEGYECVETTPSGHPADLNHGSLRSPEIYLCYRRGRDKPPLIDIGVMFEGKEHLMKDSAKIDISPDGHPANVNNSGAVTYLTYRRAAETMPCNELVVTDVCVILANKGEKPPHSFCRIDKNLNKGMVGSDVYVCYKKSMNRCNLILYKPDILARYPVEDRESFPFPSSVPMFCLPMGLTMECWPANALQPRPQYSTFVLTVSDGAEKVYGASVTFYENYTGELSDEQCRALHYDRNDGSKKTINVNKSICILSHWPFFDTFHKFLAYLYGMSIQSSLNVPVERFISHVMEKVPFPSPQRPRILVQLSSSHHVILTQPPDDIPLPRSGANFLKLLMTLEPDNCLLILLMVLTEQKVLIHSLRPDVLTTVAEAVAMMIFPFHWQCPYVPLCPLRLLDVLSAPLPFLIGVDSRFFDMYDPPNEVNCVDLDTNTITLCEEKRNLSIKFLPKKPARILRATLHDLRKSVDNWERTRRADQTKGVDRDFRVKREEMLLDLKIQEAFLRFMSTVLKGYRSYLLPITKAPTIGTTDPSSLFDMQSFMRSRDKTHHKFFNMVMKTQMFIRFIEERSFASTMDASLAFFDECAEKVDSDGGPCQLLELDGSHCSERTLFIMPPEPVSSSQDVIYNYEDGFTINPELFKPSDNQGLLRVPPKGVGATPGSPMARRTKQEIKSAQRQAKINAETPVMWSECLLSTCFSLWFIHLPSYALIAQSKSMTLCSAYDLLVRLKKAKLPPQDEVCYRVIMQLCGVYSQPVLAVNMLFEMQRSGIQPNAITYGFYNKAVLEAQWPSHMMNSSQMLWNKLRNVILGVAHFRGAARQGARRRLSLSTDDVDRLSSEPDRISRTSLESGTSQDSHINSKFGKEAGSQSDMGYSSLNEASSKGTLPRSVEAINDACKDKNANNLKSAGDGYNPSVTQGPTQGASTSDTTTLLKSIDFTASDEFRQRMGSIVRNSASSIATMSNLPTHPVNSSAGLLMTSHLNTSRVRPLTHNSQKWRHNSGNALDLESKKLPRLRHASGSEPPERLCPKSPSEVPRVSLRMLRSESFANDAQILQKLNKIHEHPKPDVKELSQALSELPPKERSCRSESQDSSMLEQKVLDYIEGVDSSRERSEDRSIESDSLSCGSDTKNGLSPTLESEGNVEENKSPSILIEDGNLRVQSSPVRTPVTENDPLGAFSTSVNTVTAGGKPTVRTHDAHTLPAQRKLSDDVLSAKAMHRSSTMPTNTTPPGKAVSSNSRAITQSPSVAASLTSLSSSFKLPFSRYSPARLSLRKADFLKGTQMIESALTSFSPSTLNKRKSELWNEGLNSIKSAATSMAKKFDDIKGVISANSTPGKATSHGTNRNNESEQVNQENNTLSVNADTSARQSMDSLSFPVIGGEHWGSIADSIMDLWDSSSRRGTVDASVSQGLPKPLKDDIKIDVLYPKSMINREPRHPVAIEVCMTTCSKCHNCSTILYDEEIMAGWTPEDSNLNTKCEYCKKWVVPFLQVTLKDFRAQAVSAVQALMTPAASIESMGSSQSIPITTKRTSGKHGAMSVDSQNTSSLSSPIAEVDSFAEEIDQDSNFLVVNHTPKTSSAKTSQLNLSTSPMVLEDIIVPYLSPLVLRKELENILEHEGDTCLTGSEFMDEHPIIYWNLVWFFQRINVMSHLPGLCLTAVSVNKDRTPHPSWSAADYNNVAVRCFWDNGKLTEELGSPMYKLWRDVNNESSLVSALVTERSSVPKTVMEKIISSVQCDDLSEPLKMIASERLKLAGRSSNRHYSAYREILFLAIVALGRENMHQMAFAQQFHTAHKFLPEKYLQALNQTDAPPSRTSIYCQHLFRDLELST